MNAIILSVGDELVLGQTVDTNSAWLSAQLAAVGCPVLAHITVPDNQGQIVRAMREAAGRCDYLIVSGGIGPTEDDLTRQALAEVMGVELVENAAWTTELEKFFLARGRPMPPMNRIQAMIPCGATMLFNTAGTAAGIEADIPPVTSGLRSATEIREAQNSCQVFVMPGVPKEMKIMFTRDVLPRIRQSTGSAVILSRTLHTFGLGESAIAEKLGDLMQRGRNPSVGTTVAGGVVSLRLNAYFASEPEAALRLAEVESACREALGDIIYGEDEQTLQEIVAHLLAQKADQSRRSPALTVSTAESCTGGLLAKMLTDVPGASAYFRQGWVAYSNEAKHKLLGVDERLLKVHGAVSEPVVRAMASSARMLAEADYALAISGIAGPDGGSDEKPVGTTWIALADAKFTSARRFVFPGDRAFIRERGQKWR